MLNISLTIDDVRVGGGRVGGIGPQFEADGLVKPKIASVQSIITSKLSIVGKAREPIV